MHFTGQLGGLGLVALDVAEQLHRVTKLGCMGYLF